MILVDANLLLYAYDPSSAKHEAARRWLEGVLSGTEPVGLAWQTTLAFLRITTHSAIFDRPLGLEEAVAAIDSIIGRPPVHVLQPTERHWSILRTLLPATQSRGALVMDAHLAALAIEHGATVHSTDRDFRRFAGLKLVDPLAT